MNRIRSISSLVSVILLLAGVPARADNVQLGLRLPPGFEVTEFADSKLANDIFCMALDPKGRVVVSGRGYIRILVDDDGDGRADRVIEFADGPKDGAQGLFWEGTSLYVMGDGGLRRYRDEDGDGRADGPSELIRAFKTGGEHDSHAIRRGPDGWLYVICGNFAGIDHGYATAPTSPIREPIAGCVVRFSPDFKTSEIVADGFRNAYAMDFNRDGELFTFDSDNERCVSLPWYEPIRFYHVLAGGHHGWRAPQRAQWWRLPPYACDVTAPVATFGRGSPTGVVCYRHVQFPEKYHGGIFLADWTFGRIYFVALERSGATYTRRKETFLEAVGENGFAPTAMAVHPVTGDLYVSIGGRGTRGAVYRIRYPKGVRSVKPEELTALQPKPRSLDWHNGLEKELIQQAASADALERYRALAAVYRHREHLQPEQIREVIRSNWDHADRTVRQATANLIALLDERERRLLASDARTPLQQITYCLGIAETNPADVVGRVCDLLRAKDTPLEARLAGVRLVQIALGGVTSPSVKGTVWEGYAPRRDKLDGALRQRTMTTLRAAFPGGDPDLDRELSRTLAVLEDDEPATLSCVAERLTASSDPVEDIHYLIVLARLPVPRSESQTRRIAEALLALDRKLTEQHRNRDLHWPLRMAELYAELAHKDPRLNAALAASPEFGRPDHALFAQAAGFDRRKAAEVFLTRAAKDTDYPWTPAQVELLGSLPEEQALSVLRRLWERGGLEQALLPLFARQPHAEDRQKFLDSLHAPQLADVRLALEALEKLPPCNDGPSVLALVRALRALGESKEEKPLRTQLAGYLQRLTGQEKFGTDREAWTTWFSKTYPDLATRLGGADGVDVAGWNKRLEAVDWTTGEVERGRAVFTKVSCASCHSGAQAVGPDLHGVTNRFSRADLFTAILQPSKDISPRYRTTRIETTEGKIYEGLIIYEAVDSVILQTGPAATMRLVNKQIASRRFTDISLMPVGLLDKATDREVADLYAYLKSLGK